MTDTAQLDIETAIEKTPRTRRAPKPATGLRLTVPATELVRVLGHMTGVAETRTSIPILAHVLLAADGGLVCRASNLEQEAAEPVEAQASGTGAVTVPAHTLHDIARKLPKDAEVTLEEDRERERLTIAAGGIRFALPTLPGEDFPDIGAGELPHNFEIDAEDTARLIERTRFAVCTDGTRYHLHGVHLHVIRQSGASCAVPSPLAPAADCRLPTADLLRAVATDGHRLAMADLPLPEGAAGLPPLTVPHGTVSELARLLKDCKGAVKISASGTRVRFEAARGLSLTSKLVDGTYPDYQRVIPLPGATILIARREALMTAVDRVAVIASRGTPVALDVGSDRPLTVTMHVPADNDGSDTAEDTVDGVSVTGPDVHIGFNPKYLLEILAALEGEKTVHIALGDPATPAMIRGVESDNPRYVLMPMRV